MNKFTKLILIIALLMTGNIVNAQYITVTVAGNGMLGFSGDGGPGNQAKISNPTDVCVDAANNIYFVDQGNNRIRKVSATTGAISTVAGGGTSTADGVLAITASLTGLTKMTSDATGNLYVSTANKIRKISAAGIITTVAGTGIAGYSGDGGPAISAQLKGPSGVCIDPAGNIYIADVSNNRIRKVTAATGIITTIAGTGASGTSGDGGPATAATLSSTNSICIDPSGNIFCADSWNIRKIAVTTGIITTVGTHGGILGICADGSGNVYFDESSCGCDKLVVATGAISVVANAGPDSYNGDGRNSLDIYFNVPAGLCMDASGNIYVADQNNNRIRKVSFLTNSPSFIYGTNQLMTTCPGYSSPLRTQLAVAELNTPVTETWTVVTPPTIGILAGFPATAMSGGADSLARPSSTTYTPAAGHTSGTDSFTVQVSNGTTSAMVKIYAAITPVPTLGPISGPYSVCLGSSISLTETDLGMWTATNAHVTINAFPGSSGANSATVSSVSLGADTVIFTLFSCPVTTTHAVTVNPLPVTAPISGSDTVCMGTTTAMSNSVAGGVWSTGYSGNITVGSSSGIITGVSYGSDHTTYTVSNPFGCTASVTKGINVNSIANPISGANSVCIGLSIPLYEDIAGGTWSVSNGNAIITGSGTSISLRGVVPGVDTVMYTNTNTCGTTTVRKIITINPLVAPGTVSGPSSVCEGATIVLTPSIPGGTWSRANGNVFVFGGNVDGNTAGIDTVFYWGTCATSAVATVITVNPLAGGTIAGSNFVCLGSTIMLSDITPGGTWSASNPNATVAATGASSAIVTGVSLGTDIIYYTSTNICGTRTVTKSISINSMVPSSGTISGPSAVCTGATINLTPSVTGGAWSTTNATATVGLTGTVTGVSAGTDIIVYTAACALTSASAVVTVNLTPSPGVISGSDTMCTATTMTFTESVSGGTWSRTGVGIATVNATSGLVTAQANGTATIKYTVTNATTGCSANTTKPLYVNVPATAISGAAVVCLASTITLADAIPGGVWSASNGHATVAGSGTSAIVTGMTTGTDTIMYTNTNMCGTAYVTKVISVDPPAVPGTISGPSSVCIGGGYAHYTETSSGGAWSTSNTCAHMIAGGYLTGVAPGVDTIIYIANSGCHTATATYVVTIGSGTSAGTITGPSSVCVGATIGLTDAVAGGVWHVSNSNATVSGSGSVIGVAMGTSIIYYTVTGTCGTATATTTITIGAPTGAGMITGPGSVCSGSTITLTDAVSGGAWSVSNGNAAISGTGTVMGVSAGIDTIFYSISSSCGSASTMAIVTILALPDAGTIISSGHVCPGSSITAVDAAAGGVWSSGAGTATVSTAGVVTGVTAGAAVISYVVSNGCGSATATQSITVDPLPDAGTITSASSSVCKGSTIALADVVPGGVWSASNGNASVSGTGIVTGIAAGAVTIKYTVTNSCGLANATKLIDVNNCSTSGIPTASSPVIRLFPNPASSGLEIAWTNWFDKNAQVTISDVTGRVVSRAELVNSNNGNGTQQINISELNDGIYLLMINSESVHYTEKVVVSKK